LHPNLKTEKGQAKKKTSQEGFVFVCGGGFWFFVFGGVKKSGGWKRKSSTALIHEGSLHPKRRKKINEKLG